MYIKDSIVANFGNFKLAANAIELRSLSDEDIKLPYMGVLPRQLSSASSAHIYFNIQVAQGVIVMLVVNLKNGKQTKHSVSASNEELIFLLDKFFAQNRDKTGLNRYCLGLWWAYYISWKKIVTMPERLLSIISTLSIKDKLRIKDYIKEDLQAEY